MGHWSEIEQEPYDPEEFVERLAWRTTGGAGGAAGRDPELAPAGAGTPNAKSRQGGGAGAAGAAASSSSDEGALQLHDAFVEAIKELTQMHETQRKKCEMLEQRCREEEQNHWKRLAALIEQNRSAAFTYKSLDEKISSVATKVVHLGDQLESVNTPRSRDVEALKLMKHFDEFLGGETNLSPVFNDKSRLHEAADVIQKLQLIAQELPQEKFKDAIRAIDKKYSEIERALIEEFVKSHRSNDNHRMKDIALILSHFKGYNQCVDAFIEQIQLQQCRGKDLFKEIVPLCDSSWKLIEQVFPNPQQVMSKFVLNIYHNKVKEHVAAKLSDKNNSETYLNNLHSLYSQTVKLTADLAHFHLGSDQLFLTNLSETIFRSYLDSYINIECRYLNEKCSQILQKYYQSKGHQKKQLSGGTERLQDIKRDIHGFIASKANFNLETTVSYGGETFLSEEVAINILQLTKLAFKRCAVLSHSKDGPSNTCEIMGLLISYLVHEHIDYAIEIGLQGIPIAESKTIPELYFFDVLGQTNAIMHLFEKQFFNSILPLVASTPKHSDCLQRKKNEQEKMEHKLDAGLDRTLHSLVGWVKTILGQEQRKTDFNPTSTKTMMTTASSACVRVVKFLGHQHEKIKESMDGKNIECVLQELGIRVHRVIYDHLLQFAFSSAGAMSVICDVQEYRRCMAEFKIPSVNALFDTLHAMCNLLILPPENLRGAMCGDQLATLDKTILDNWIQLRIDYKSEKLGNFM